MIIYKCKMCGGTLNIGDDNKVVICEYCRTQQTVPTTDDEKRMNLFNRANHFRQNSEFDKAMGIYEHILDEDSSDAEAYWSIALCKYGVEYVEDPVSRIHKPTINRTLAHSILNDADYLMAIKHADYSRRVLYEKEAIEIDRIQKEILQIAKNEPTYDIFISYKEKSSNGERTHSSVLAQDLYNHLVKEGYRVFFSRVSLEDKVGQKYEPYIYSALNSAKIMLVIGTTKEEFMAPWVRNEWGRFLVMMREDTNKLLIPCFKDLDIDDLPDEFQVLQSQDMSKIGFEQDLIRGIEKVLRKESAKSDAVGQVTGNTKTPERVLQNAETYMSLQNYSAALRTFEGITNTWPEDYRGWWGLIRAKTCDFSKKEYDEGLIKTLNVWFGYIKKLAGDEKYKKVLKDYTSYLEMISQCHALSEIEDVKHLIQKYKVDISSDEGQLQFIEREIDKERRAYQDRENSLNIKMQEYDRSISGYNGKAGRNIIIKAIAWVVLIGSFLIGVTLMGSGSVEGAPIFFVGGIIGLVLVKLSGMIESASSVNKRVQGLINSKSDFGMKVDENRNKFETDLVKLNNKKIPHIKMIETNQQKIAECCKYIEFGLSGITSLLFALECERIGVKKDYDEEMLSLRNKVLMYPENAGQNQDKEERFIEIKCDVCKNTNRAPMSKIKDGSNFFRCTYCEHMIRFQYRKSQ